MNTKFLSALTATAVATALFGAAAPAKAASFGTGGISFSRDTDTIFTFIETHGGYRSSLGIYEVNGSIPSLVKTLFTEVKGSDNGSANEWKGTLGNTVLGSGKVAFTFLADKVYTLGLASGGLRAYSTSSLNSGTQKAVFGGPSLFDALNKDTTSNFKAAGENTNGLSSLFKGGSIISFDDGGNGKDRDFQDFTVSAKAAGTAEAEPVPEPMTMTGLALGLGGLVAARRRRQGNNTAS